jgi:uncharacterized membrane protein
MTATPSEVTGSAPPSGARFPLVLPGRVCGIGAGWTWIVQGWRLFARAPVMWIVALLLLVIIAFALMLVPFLGHIAVQVLGPVFGAGLVLACAALETRGDFELGEIFGGFRTRFGSLALVGLLFFVGQVVIFVVALGIAGFGTMAGIFGMLVNGDSESAMQALLAASTSMLLAVLVAAALYIPLLAAVWLAPALVVMHGVGPGAAMAASFSACLRNFLPFLWYGIVMMVFAVVAALPFMLGYLAWVPVAVTSTYAAYRGIFTEGEIVLPD